MISHPISFDNTRNRGILDISFVLTMVFKKIFRHVIVGRNFGSYVTHETKHFIYFYLGQVAILLFKSG